MKFIIYIFIFNSIFTFFSNSQEVVNGNINNYLQKCLSDESKINEILTKKKINDYCSVMSYFLDMNFIKINEEIKKTDLKYIRFIDTVEKQKLSFYILSDNNNQILSVFRSQSINREIALKSNYLFLKPNDLQFCIKIFIESGLFLLIFSEDIDEINQLLKEKQKHVVMIDSFFNKENREIYSLNYIDSIIKKDGNLKNKSLNKSDFLISDSINQFRFKFGIRLEYNLFYNKMLRGYYGSEGYSNDLNGLVGFFLSFNGLLYDYTFSVRPGVIAGNENFAGVELNLLLSKYFLENKYYGFLCFNWHRNLVEKTNYYWMIHEKIEDIDQKMHTQIGIGVGYNRNNSLNDFFSIDVCILKDLEKYYGFNIVSIDAGKVKYSKYVNLIIKIGLNFWL